MSTEINRKKKTFQCSGHTEAMLKKIQSHQELCDVLLIAGTDGICVSAHLLVLSACSEFFSAMFRTPMRESDEKKVTLENVSGSVLQAIVNYCYSGLIDLDEDNVEAVLETASLMQLDALVAACAEFLVTSLHSSNCLGIAQFVQQHNCHDAHEQAQAFIHVHYMQVCKSDEFLKLNVEQLCPLIASDDLVVHSEVDVFNSCLAWLNHDRQNRKKQFTKLLSLMRLPLLPSGFITDHVKPHCKSKRCKDLIIETLEWKCQPQSQSQMSSSRTRPRKSTGDILLALGMCPQSNFTVHWYNSSLDEWTNWPLEIPHVAHSVCVVLGDSLLIVGTRDFYDYNFETKTVASLSPPNTLRDYMRGAVLCGCLYIIGGCDLSTNILLKSVERWDPEVCTWSYMAPLGTGRSQLGAAVVDELLYAVGGMSSTDYYSRTVECYNRHLNEWTPRASMNRSRCSFGITAGNGCLYVVGGGDDHNSNTDTVERYDPLADEWTMLCSIRNALYNIECAFLGNRLLAVGGGDMRNWLPNVEEYNVETNTWSPKKPISLTTEILDRFRVLKISQKYVRSELRSSAQSLAQFEYS